ncbi:hypothetical protein D3P09_02815 [Paenibacillus pinisoli]|uniref:Uncharacterized protein n=1 Tax=Paenibacillus pinisoli TaxID=1276110 RepID=A0A3A6PIB0_9BACL|nr:hypothetical protein D3P09_02815 [Paenibacillus pinisoli]
MPILKKITQSLVTTRLGYSYCVVVLSYPIMLVLLLSMLVYSPEMLFKAIMGASTNLICFPANICSIIIELRTLHNAVSASHGQKGRFQ